MTDLHAETVFFWTGPFSQWHPAVFQFDGHEVTCAEQAMMYAKAKLFGDAETADMILAAKEPGKQKALGRCVRGFSDDIWDQEKIEIVRAVNREKYTQCKGLRRKLLQTAQRPLVEASPMDVIWGIGLDERAARATPRDLWPGQNLLGQVLMDVREEMSLKFPNEAANVATG